MEDLRQPAFGLVIAYLLPGLVTLAGLSPFSPTIAGWLQAHPTCEPTVGSFLYAVLGSLAAGLTVSAVRWAIVDTLHHRTGIPLPQFDFTRLQQNVQAYLVAVEFHYRYYQCYGNNFIAVLVWWLGQVVDGRGLSTGGTVACIVLEIILWAASRDTLRRYYERGGQALSNRKRLS